MKPKTTTRTYSKALARSGPELRPEQILLDENDQELLTQSDFNHKIYEGGGGPGPGPDLTNYATIAYSDQKDAALNGALSTRIDKNEQAIGTTNGNVSTNTSDISSLQKGFDDALKAAKEGAENIEIEFQSTAKKADTYTKTQCDATFAKKEDIPEGADLSAYAKTEYVDAADDQIKIEVGSAAKKADDAMAKATANETAIGNIEIPEVPSTDGLASTDYVDALTFQVAEAEDSSFTEPNTEKEAEAEAGSMAATPSLGLVNGENVQGRVWFQGGGGTGVSLEGSTVRITTTSLNNRSKSNESRLNKITPEGDDLGRVQARAGAGTSAFTVKNASEDNAETLTVSGAGDVVARSFEGDGSKLTNLPAAEVADQVTYQIQTDQVLRSGEPAIELVDSDSNFSNVKFAGSDGIAVSSDMASIKISAKPLRDEVIEKVPPLVNQKLKDYATTESVDQKLAALPSPTYVDWNNLPNLTTG